MRMVQPSPFFRSLCLSLSLLFRPTSSSSQMSDKKSYMTTDAAARIQSSQAKSGGSGGVSSGSFASRAQSAAAKNVNTGNTSYQGGKKK